jgi:hypothetical protein
LRNTENKIRAGAEISPLFQRIGVTKRWWICPFGAWTLSAPHNLALAIKGDCSEMDVDFKLIISGLGFFISLISFGMAFSAKKEAKQTIVLDLIHKKRMMLTEHFSEVLRIDRALRNQKIDDADISGIYEQLVEYKNQLIQAMNESSETVVSIKSLDKKILLNEISDNSLMYTIHKVQIIDLENYIANKSRQMTAEALAC